MEAIILDLITQGKYEVKKTKRALNYQSANTISMDEDICEAIQKGCLI